MDPINKHQLCFNQQLKTFSNKDGKFKCVNELHDFSNWLVI